MKIVTASNGKKKVKMSKKEWQGIGKKAGWIKTANLVVKEDIEYKAAPYGYIATIPAGTPVVPADNLPDGGYWVSDWNDMDDKAESWMRNYGFHVGEEEVAYVSEPTHDDIQNRKWDNLDEAEYHKWESSTDR